MAQKTPPDDSVITTDCRPLLYAIIYTFLTLTTIVFAGRTWSRVRIVKRFQAYDWVMTIAFCDIVVMHAMLHEQLANGVGLNYEWSLAHPVRHVFNMKVGYVENICYQSALGLIKIGILLQYYSLATSLVHKRLIVGLLCFVIIFSTFTTLSAILLCLPLGNVWNPDVFPEGCWNTSVVNTVSSSVNMATDVAIYFLPIPILVRLNLPTRKKWGLVGVFCVAFVAVGASIGRLTSLGAWAKETTVLQGSMIPVWGGIEADSAMIAVSLPLLKPLFVLTRDKVLSVQTGWGSSRRQSGTTLAASRPNKPSVSSSDSSSQKKPQDPYSAGSVLVTNKVEIEEDTQRNQLPGERMA